ncbi:MAG: Ig-like domain-containing protein [Proteobacteria bacterium]|nr:Ig-like domain-containing protein [Pseudomonadota bacterium]
MLTGCGDDAGPLLPHGPGVLFSFPYDGQFDVPPGVTIAIAFTDAVDSAALGAGCRLEEEGVLSGAFCVVDEDNRPISGVAEVAGSAESVILFRSDDIAAGATYQIHTRPSLLRVAADNLPTDTPLITFYTRQAEIRVGEPPLVVAVNGESPAAFEAESSVEPRFPFVDFASLRLLFSEPIDPFTVVEGDTFRIYTVDEEKNKIDVPGTLLVQGIHLTFDPDSDLTVGETYFVDLEAGIKDLIGEELAPRQFVFKPENTRNADGELLEQVLNAEPADGDQRSLVESRLVGISANTLSVSSPVIGTNQITVKDGNISSEMADPKSFGKLIPIAIRKGQLLYTNGLDVAFGGVIPADLSTGDIQVSFLSDASGFLMRNPFRNPDLVPDDAEAPVFLVLTFDVAVSAADATGNAVLTQTVMNVQATGVASADLGALAIETIGTMELDLLGITRAPTNLALRLATNPGGQVEEDQTPPRLTATYPIKGQQQVAVTEAIFLTFSEPIAATQLSLPDDVSLADAAEQPVDIAVTDYGSTLVIVPAAPLAPGTSYTLTMGAGFRDLAGNALMLSSDDPTGGLGTLDFTTFATSPDDPPAAPLVTAIYPGAPCALRNGSSSSPGRCVGGLGDDGFYALFEVPAGREIQASFNQAIKPDSLVMGTECGAGSVRVEAFDQNGVCQSPVGGLLVRGEREFRFIPNQPWMAGQKYRLTLVAGPDGSCLDGEEICGVNDQALNTDPLCGTFNGNADVANPGCNGVTDEGGGPDLVIEFTGSAATSATFVSLVASPISDANGNGVLDPGEVAHDQNRAINRITAVDGQFVEEAWFPQGDDPATRCDQARDDKDEFLHLTTNLPVSIGTEQSNCEIGQDGQGNPIVVEKCVPAEIFPQLIFGTNLGICAQVFINGTRGTIDTPTQQLLLRLRQPLVDPLAGNGPIKGYIIQESGSDKAQFVSDLSLYIDAPDMSPPGGLEADLHSKEVAVTVKGPVSFTSDGRIQINAANTTDTIFAVTLSDPSIPDPQGPGDPLNKGSISLTIPAGEMKLQLFGLPSKDAHLRP